MIILEFAFPYLQAFALRKERRRLTWPSSLMSFLLLRSFLLVRSLIELGGYQHDAVVLDTFLVAPLFRLEVAFHREHGVLGELVE